MLQINDQNDVIATANRLFICTDNRDWQCVRDVFAPEVLFDMTSLGGGQPEKKTPQQIADMWGQGLKALNAIHHQAGNYQVTLRGKEADLFCYGIAYHYLPNPTNQNTRIFVGSYTFHLVRSAAGWKIDRFKFNLKFIDGKKDLEGVAQQ
jgi:3-phenylpropionate/cinnamic acid dioxygenase small subunit